jgi:hypothetical protein
MCAAGLEAGRLLWQVYACRHCDRVRHKHALVARIEHTGRLLHRYGGQVLQGLQQAVCRAVAVPFCLPWASSDSGDRVSLTTP